VVVVAIDLVAVGTQVPVIARLGAANFSLPHRLVRDADVDPFAFFGPTGPIVQAQDRIPSNATYSMRIGRDANAEVTRDVYRFWLLPRTYTTSPDAQWFIRYHVGGSNEVVIARNIHGAGDGS